MTDFPSLSSLGPRVMICGPSNAGKSTLALDLSRKLEAEPVHLDLLYHLAGTNWQPRPATEFEALHNKAIADERWVIEGNYFALIGPRLQRATGIILLGSGRLPALYRYVRRTFSTKPRPGMLDGATDRLSLNMLRFILIEQPRKRERDRTILRSSGLPIVEIGSIAHLRQLYGAWTL